MITLDTAMDSEKYTILDDMDKPTMDMWVSQHVGISKCKGEADLFASKWFDYRIMHPLVATCLFTEVYKVKHAQIIRTHGREDINRSWYMTGLPRSPYLEMSKANITSLWKARQMADRYCVSYDYFIETILSIAASRLWNKLPRPQHFWQEELVELFEAKLKARMLITFDDCQFSYANMRQIVNAEIQRDYCKWVLERLKSMPNQKRIFSLVGVLMKQLVPQELLQTWFPSEFDEAYGMAFLPVSQ